MSKLVCIRPEHLPDLGRPKIEASIELLNTAEDLFIGQVRVTDRGQLHPLSIY
jgi:hypothetical protein